MAWRAKRVTIPGSDRKTVVVERIHPEPKVYRDHLAILRSIQAPDDVIKIAEEVVAANTQTAGTKM